jgi:4-hydroxybenzoate polyprenyltransferase
MTYPKTNLLGIIAAMAILLAGIFDLDPYSFTILGISFTLVLIYENIFFSSFNLRKSPYGKPFVISLVWTLVGTSFNGTPDLVDFLDCYIFIFLLCIPFDLKDLESDKNQGIKTLPLLFKEKTPLLLGVFFTLYSSVFYQFTGEFFFIFAPIIFSILISLKKRSSFIFHLGFDGIIIMRFLFYLYQY